VSIGQLTAAKEILRHQPGRLQERPSTGSSCSMVNAAPGTTKCGRSRYEIVGLSRKLQTHRQRPAQADGADDVEQQH
jgi:hypothetical protein